MQYKKPYTNGIRLLKPRLYLFFWRCDVYATLYESNVRNSFVSLYLLQTLISYVLATFHNFHKSKWISRRINGERNKKNHCSQVLMKMKEIHDENERSSWWKWKKKDHCSQVMIKMKELGRIIAHRVWWNERYMTRVNKWSLSPNWIIVN